MFLVFYPGQNKSSTFWDAKSKSAEEVEKIFPKGSVAIDWKPINGDLNLDNYELIDGVVVYSPPPPPVVVRGMDLLAFNALFLQGYIEGIFTQSQLIDAELAQKITDEQYRNAWLRGLIGNGSPEQQQRLFKIAEQCNIPLPKI